MSSQIVEIFAAISAWSITVDGKTPLVRDIDEVKDQFAEGDHPMRMMLVTTGDMEAGSAPFVAMGKLQHITWVIEDRLYWRPLGAGQGLVDYNGDLVRYCKAYLEAVRDNRAFTSAIKQSHVTDVRAVPAIVRFPDVEDGVPYAGVRCFLTVEDYVTGA